MFAYEKLWMTLSMGLFMKYHFVFIKINVYSYNL